MKHVDILDVMRSDNTALTLELQNAREIGQHWKGKFYALCYGSYGPLREERVLHERREALLLRKLRWANVRIFFALICLVVLVVLCFP